MNSGRQSVERRLAAIHPREACKRLLEIDPGLTIAGYKADGAVFCFPELLAVMVEGFRKTGFPEE